MTGGIKQKNSYEILKQKTRACLLKWKRLTFFERVQSDSGEVEDSQMWSRQWSKKENVNLNNTSVYNPILPVQDQSMLLKRSYMTQGNGQFSTIISPIQANKATFKS